MSDLETCGTVVIKAPEMDVRWVSEGPQGPAGPAPDWQGSVPTWSALPATGVEADLWLVADTGHGAAWDMETSTWKDTGMLQGPQGVKGSTGNQGPPGVAATAVYSWRMSAQTDADVDPGSGTLTIETTGGNNRRLAISKTDAVGGARNPGLLLPGSAITVVYDANGTSPADQVALYTLVQAPVDMGTWVKMETVREGLTGSATPPPAGSTLQVIADLGEGGYYLTQHVSDVRYESKSALLQEAAWHVDAGVISTDRLTDLTGRGRDAIFGAGAAAPVVLPWTGEDYVHYPVGVASQFISIPTAVRSAVPTYSVELDMEVLDTSVQSGLFCTSLGANSYPGTWGVYTQPGGNLVSMMWPSGSPESKTLGTVIDTTARLRHRFTFTNGVATYETSPDGTTWVLRGTSAAHSRATIEIDASFYLMLLGGTAYGPKCNIYRVSADNGALILDPRNVNADYTKIANTGSAGGNWKIGRAATGMKCAVVDRPLLLFGGAQSAVTSSVAQCPEITMLAVVRVFGTPTVQNTWLDTQVGGSTGPGRAAMYRPPGASHVAYFYDSVSVKSSTIASNAYLGSTVVGLVGTRTQLKAYNQGVYSGAVAVVPGDVNYGRNGYSVGQNYNATAGMEGEFVAAAIWDRALTDAEIAQVSQELAGVPHEAQTDPHGNYAPLVAGSTAAALPATAREGTIAILADNTLAIRTRTGGWRAVTTTPLTGAPPA